MRSRGGAEVWVSRRSRRLAATELALTRGKSDVRARGDLRHVEECSRWRVTCTIRLCEEEVAIGSARLAA